MNKTLSLTKVLLKNGSGNAGKNAKKFSLSNPWVVGGLVALGLIPIFGFIAAFVSMLYEGLAPIGQEGFIPALGLTLTSAVVFIFGVFYVINVFFFSKDIEHLLPLPLKSTEILSAKFIVTLIYEYLTALFILAPILVIFGVKSGAGMVYYLYSLVIFLTLPIIPLLLAAIISMLIMRFTNIAKNKDRYRMIGGSVTVILVLGMNALFQRVTRQSMDPDAVQDLLLQGNNTIIDTLSTLFPHTKLGTLALIESGMLQGLLYLLGFLAASAVAYVVFMLLGKAFYFGSVIGISEASSRRKALSGEQMDRQTRQNSVVTSFLLKEMRILIRTPAYFTNCVLLSFLWPVILFFPFVVQPESLEFITGLAASIDLNQHGGIVLAIAFAVLLFISGINMAAGTSISREGSIFFVNKYLPVPAFQIMLAKVMSGVILSAVSMVLMLAAIYFVMVFPLTYIGLMFLLSIPAMFFGSLVSIIIDVHFPKLNWDTEQKAVKQNFNPMFSMLACIFCAALIIAATVLLSLSWIQVFFSLLIIFGIASLLLLRLIRNKADIWFQRIEE
ncbi:putative ABC transporter permease subunit [Paenibacillus senegalensis]|uniref:putative ABC transporter permease subunit n=1 Tax=Paenibacillus senegalensis TaxID=1465766 RepID=UPI000288E98B|nr:hypothetical protein [Paenibacillus senegalensis]